MSSPDLKPTLDAWSEILIKVLQLRIARLQVRNTGSLFSSLKYNVEGSDSTLKSWIMFNLYGKFRDMGVGRGVQKGNRKRAEWYSKAFYAEVMKLKSIIATKYGEAAANTLVTNIEAINDLKYNAYRSSDLSRNASNYRKQINLPAEQRTWVKTK